MKKLYLYYIKTVSGGLVREEGVLKGFCFAHWGKIFFFFSITEKIKQSTVQQRLLRLYSFFASYQLTRRGLLFRASANTAPSGGRPPGQGRWRKSCCACG